MKNIKKYFFYLALFILTFAVCAIKNSADRDIWHRLAAGALFFKNGWVARHDIFAYTPTKHLWIDHEWGSGVIFYFLTKYLGDYGIFALKVILLFSIIIIIYKTAILISPQHKYKIGFLTLSLFALLPGFGSTIRCQSFTYFFFALWLYLLERIRRDEKRFIWIFPATTLLWANLHGGFLAGIGLIFIYLAGEFLNRKNISSYLKILVLVMPVTFINPYGIDYWHYMIEAVTMPRPYIGEWKSLNLFYPPYDWFGFKILLLIGTFVLCYRLLALKTEKYVNIDKTGLLLILTTLVISFRQERHAVFFVIVASIFLYSHFYDIFKQIFEKHLCKLKDKLSEKKWNLFEFLRQSMAYSLIIIIGGYFSVVTPCMVAVPDKEYPTKAVEFIKINNLKGNLLVPFNWSSYALWKLYPQCLVSIDGRYEEVYSQDVYLDIVRFGFAFDGWQAALDKYHNDIILVEAYSKTFKKLTAMKNWKNIYKDKVSAIFVPAGSDKKSWIMPVKGINYSKEKYVSEVNKV